MSNGFTGIGNAAIGRGGAQALEYRGIDTPGEDSQSAAGFHLAMQSAQYPRPLEGGVRLAAPGCNADRSGPSREEFLQLGQSATLEQSISDHNVAVAGEAKRHAIRLKHEAKHSRLVALLHKRDAKHSRRFAQSVHDAHADATAKLQHTKHPAKEALHV